MILLLIGGALACPSLGAALDRAAGAGAATDAGRAALAEATESLACAPQTSDTLGWYWLLEAERLTDAGDPARAALARDAGRRLLRPEDPRLVGLPAPEAPGAGWIDLDTNRSAARVDATVPARWPAEVPAGLHLVQVVTPGGDEVRYGKIVRVVADEEVLVETGLPELAPVPVAAIEPLPISDTTLSEPPPPARSPWWFVVSGVAAGGAAGLYYLADHERPAIATAEDLDALESAYMRQRLYASGAVLLSAGTAFGVVGYFVF